MSSSLKPKIKQGKRRHFKNVLKPPMKEVVGGRAILKEESTKDQVPQVIRKTKEGKKSIVGLIESAGQSVCLTAPAGSSMCVW